MLFFLYFLFFLVYMVSVLCPGQIAQLVGAPFLMPKCDGFNSQSVYIPMLQVQSLYGRQRNDVSLSDKYFSPPPSSLFLRSISISSSRDLKRSGFSGSLEVCVTVSLPTLNFPIYTAEAPKSPLRGRFFLSPTELNSVPRQDYICWDNLLAP